MLENLIYAKRKALLTRELEAGNVPESAIAFIGDTKQIYAQGQYFGNTKVSELENDMSYVTSDVTTRLDEKIETLTAKTAIQVTTVSNLPINADLIVSTLSASASFSLASVPTAGKEIHVLVKNAGTSDITITLPTASPYIPVNGDHTTVPVGGYSEINAISDGTKIYLRAL